MTQRLTLCSICTSVSYISWSIDFALYLNGRCHRLKYFDTLIMVLARGIHVLQALALVSRFHQRYTITYFPALRNVTPRIHKSMRQMKSHYIKDKIGEFQ